MQSAFRQTGLSNRTASNTVGGSGSQKSKILNCGLSTFSTTYQNDMNIAAKAQKEAENKQ